MKIKKSLAILGLFVALFIQTETSLATISGLADSSWPVFHGDRKLTGQSKYDTSKTNGTIKWEFKAEGQIETSPVIDAKGVIYFADHRCYLYAINQDGSLKWKFKGGEPVRSIEWGGESCAQGSPTIGNDGTIYFLPMSGNFYAITSDGSEKWKYPVFTFKNAWPTPAIGLDRTIYVGSELYPPTETGRPQERPSYFYAFNPDGSLKWSWDPGGSSWVNGTPAIADDGTILVSANDCADNNCANMLFAITTNKEIKWKFNPPEGVQEGSPMIGPDGTIYFLAKGAKDPRKAFAYALTSDGEQKWRTPFENGLSITPALSNDSKLFFGDWGGIFYGYDTSGKELWRSQTPNQYEALSSSPALGSDGTIYFGTLANYFYAYSPDGKEKWKIPVSSGVDSSPAIGSDGTIYFTSIAGSLYAIGSGQGPAVQNSFATQGQSTKNSNSNLLLTLIAVGTLLVIFVAIILAIHKANKMIIVALVICSVFLIILIWSVFNKNSKNDSASAPASSANPCPRRVYGDAGSYYGIFGMDQRNIIQTELDQYRKNCKDTIWPEDTQSGYRGD
ncbi:PQQ-like beta-propeller repeat protein [Candidatus Berkelbacteria bacterium]|nr:PQQ-like beta-propeller repeat protein [Candidatus Berkelbacteria bacterium]